MNGPPLFVGTEEPTLLVEALLRINDAIAILADGTFGDMAARRDALAVLKRGQA